MSDLKYAGSYDGSSLGFTGTGPDAPTTTGGGGGDVYGALINLGSTIYASETARNNSKRTVKANKDAAELAYQRELEAWNRQNEYNDPASQMARYRGAGLNPNMIYGSGGASAGNATTLPKYNAPTARIDYQAPDIGQALSMYQDFRMKQAQIDNVKANTEYTQANTSTIPGKVSNVQAKTDNALFDLDTKSMMRPYNAKIGEANAQKADLSVKQELKRLAMMDQDSRMKELQQSYLKGNIGIQGQERERRQAELLMQQYKGEQGRAGINSTDHIFFRLLVRMLNQSLGE